MISLVLLLTLNVENLDFSKGRLDGWQGTGFVLQRGQDRCFTVSSSEIGLLHRTFKIPRGAGTIHFRACAHSGTGDRPQPGLTVYLEAAERKIVPRLVRLPSGDWQAVSSLLPAHQGQLRDYVWQVADLQGQTVRIVLWDRDNTPGHDLTCSGFTFQPVDRFQAREFERVMAEVVRKGRLLPTGKMLQSDHFLGLGNTDEQYITFQLENCELLYKHFLNYFRHKGFELTPPSNRLMVAVFASQEGVEAYLGQRLPNAVTGLYHPPSNRLLVYDYGRNRLLNALKEQSKRSLRDLAEPQRQLVVGALERRAAEIRADTNLATIMHEAAHLLSFNTGLLNRTGDLPLWLVEGLACFCEPTEAGFWKGIGKSNPERLRPLVRALQGDGRLLPLKTLIADDEWLRGPDGPRHIYLGYAQSWALLSMLVEQQPRALHSYLRLIYDRKTREHRLADFAQCFGSDLEGLEKRYQSYIKALVGAVKRDR